MGRPPKNGTAMSNAERQKARWNRLAAREVAADALNRSFESMQDHLRTSGRPDLAGVLTWIRRSAALNAVAEYARRNQSFFVTRGNALPDPTTRAQTEQRIESLAEELDVLASAALSGGGDYREFESVLSQMQKIGFFPEGSLVSDVARAFLAPGI